MSYEKVGKLIRSLHANTKAGSITWEETERHGTYQVSFPNYTIRLSNRVNPYNPYDGDTDYVIQIINGDGDVVDEVSDVDVKDIVDNSYNVMKDLHDMARRQAFGVEKALDEILNDLNSFNNDNIPL